MDRAMLNSLGLMVVSTIVGGLMTWFWWTKARAVDKAKTLALEHEKLLARVTELETKLGLVSQQVVPFNALFQQILIRELTHYHTPELDRLMKKIGPPSTLSDVEERRMTVLLSERTRDMGPEISDSERDAALMLPAIIKRAKLELASLSDAENMKLKLVTVAAVIGVPASAQMVGDKTNDERSRRHDDVVQD